MNQLRSWVGIAGLAVANLIAASLASADHQGDITQFVNNFGQGLNTDPQSEWFGGGDNLWENPANWNNHGPPNEFVSPKFAFINVNPVEGGMSPATVSSPGAYALEAYVGQGLGNGELLVTSGGVLDIQATLYVAHDSGRDGLVRVDGGNLNIGFRDPGGTPLTIAHLYFGHNGGTASAEITGGETNVTGNIRLSDFMDDSSASSDVNISGGTVTTGGLVAIGVRTGGTGTGQGDLTIGGDAVVDIGANVAMRPGSGNSFTVDGSGATININRPEPTATGFEVHQDNNVNFIFDSSGISPVSITNATMRWSHADSTLNVDASALSGTGTFDLFTFAGGYFPTGITGFGTENLTFAPGFSGSVAYNPNSITLTIVESAGLAGDFNMDGSVDAADYVVWRKTIGSQAKYEEWRDNFGVTASGAGGAAGAIPEPLSISLLLMAGFLAATRYRPIRDR